MPPAELGDAFVEGVDEEVVVVGARLEGTEEVGLELEGAVHAAELEIPQPQFDGRQACMAAGPVENVTRLVAHQAPTFAGSTGPPRWVEATMASACSRKRTAFWWEDWSSMAWASSAETPSRFMTIPTARVTVWRTWRASRSRAPRSAADRQGPCPVAYRSASTTSVSAGMAASRSRLRAISPRWSPGSVVPRSLPMPGSLAQPTGWRTRVWSHAVPTGNLTVRTRRRYHRTPPSRRGRHCRRQVRGRLAGRSAGSR